MQIKRFAIWCLNQQLSKQQAGKASSFLPSGTALTKNTWIQICVSGHIYERCISGCVWESVHTYWCFMIKINISECYKTVWRFPNLPPVFVYFRCCNECHTINFFLKEISAKYSDLKLAIGGFGVWNSRLAFGWFTTNSQASCLEMTLELLCRTNTFSCQCHTHVWQHWLCPGRHPLSAAHSNPSVTVPPHHQHHNKARQMISICPLQSSEEVIDTIRQMMSRICQQSL